MKNLLPNLLIIMSICSCSTYPSKFMCHDAKGLNCQMLRLVDKKIDTGEIEGFFLCKSKKCSINNG